MKDKTVVAALRRLETDGRLTPDAVVDAARPINSPLHSFFEWDDTAAAHEWRREQARELIRSVTVEVTTDDREIMSVCYVRDPRKEPGEQGYVTVQALRGAPADAALLLAYELGRVTAILARAERLALALSVAPGAITTRLVALRNRVHKLSAHVAQLG